MLERILVPTDFSDGSLTAVSHAGALARRFHSEVTLLHVNELLFPYVFSGPLGFGSTQGESERAERLSGQRKQLDEFGAEELSGVSVKRVLRCGDPAKLIVECGRLERSDLMIMPTHGHGVFRRLLLGSVTAKVLHDAECPVWTGVHFTQAHPPPNPIEAGHVMCAVNLESESHKALKWAAAFASALNASLTVVHAVVETPRGLPARYRFQWHEEAHWGADEMLRELVRELGIQADVLVVSNGNVPKALSQALRDKPAGLLVIERNGAGDAAGRLGNTTYSIICHSSWPVVSI